MLPERDNDATSFDENKNESILIKLHNIIDICTIAKHSVIFSCDQNKTSCGCEQRKYATAFELILLEVKALEAAVAANQAATATTVDDPPHPIYQ